MYGSFSIIFLSFVWLISGQSVHGDNAQGAKPPTNAQGVVKSSRPLGTDIHDLLNELKDQPLTDIFNRANRAFHDKEYHTAVQAYRVLNSLYPFSEYAEKSRLYSIQVYYHLELIDEVIRAADKFIELYPTSEDLEAVSYLKAEAFFNRHSGILKSISDFLPSLKIDFSERLDGVHLSEAADKFTEFLNRFPNGAYREKAQQKLDEIHKLLVKKEYNIAHFYFQRKNYLAAYNRIVGLLKQYPGAGDILTKKEADILYREYRDVKQKLGLTS